MEELPDVILENDLANRYYGAALDCRTRMLVRIGTLGTMAGYYALDAYRNALALPDGDQYNMRRQNYENIFLTNSKINSDCRDAIVLLDDSGDFESLNFAIELLMQIDALRGDSEMYTLWVEYRGIVGEPDGQS